jgi:hypothetical protein
VLRFTSGITAKATKRPSSGPIGEMRSAAPLAGHSQHERYSPVASFRGDLPMSDRTQQITYEKSLDILDRQGLIVLLLYGVTEIAS